MKWGWPLLFAATGCATPPYAGHEGARGELVLRCTPFDAEVQLDGVPQGLCSDFSGTPRGLSMGKGTRRVEVSKPGYAPWERWLDADTTRVMMTVRLVENHNGERAQ